MPTRVKAKKSEQRRIQICYLGIDPGWSGGIGWIYGTWSGAFTFKNMTERDIYEAFFGLINNWEVPNPDKLVAVLEAVHSMPKQGVASSFKFGQQYGLVEMALIANNISYQKVTPQKWQKEMSCRSGGDKNVTKRRAQQLFPKHKFTHGIADALLLAEYCRRVNK